MHEAHCTEGKVPKNSSVTVFVLLNSISAVQAVTLLEKINKKDVDETKQGIIQSQNEVDTQIFHLNVGPISTEDPTAEASDASQKEVSPQEIEHIQQEAIQRLKY